MRRRRRTENNKEEPAASHPDDTIIIIQDLHLTPNTVILTTLKANLVGLAINHALRMLKDYREKKGNRLLYQKTILAMNGGGDKNPNYKPGYGRWRTKGMARKYVEYNGMPCFECRLLIPLNSRTVRRRAGSTSKYYHCTCWERIMSERLPLVTEAEREAAKLGIYPVMQFRGSRA